MFIFLRTPPPFDFVYSKGNNICDHSSLLPDRLPHLKNVSSKLIDIDFHYKILNFACENHPKFVIFVSSSTVNFKKREAIRTTWGKNKSSPILFALGSVENQTIQSKINDENKKYSDIIQGNFVDTYKNLSYKQVMMLKYVNDYCSNSMYLVKMDDDVFVNMPQLTNFIHNDLSPNYTHNLILGDVYINAPVLREPSKWRVTPEEFLPNVYPTYCPGYRIIYSMDIVHYLYRQSHNTAVKYFWIDDVYVSGILATKLKDVHKDIGPLTATDKMVKEYLKACEDQHPEFLIFISSSTVNFKNRAAIRSTWGKNQSSPILFALGSVQNEEIQSKINAENEKYSDIIQGSFLDTYRNLTYKHVMMLKYVNDYCSNAIYLVKIDDDVFVNMPQLTNFIHNDLSPNHTHQMGDVLKDSPVLRKKSKWRVSSEEFLSNVYPTYCPGWRIIYSMDIVQYLYRQSQNTAVIFFWIDDVFVSGILAAKLKDVHKNIGPLTMTHTTVKQYLKGSKRYSCFVFSSFSFDVNQNGPLMEFLRNQTSCFSVANRLNWINK
ncbi:unnamed protein product [Brassicogethes aeneus]|uniref:Hexosyltransferase n=1 Tax=Brassicogethes aeneus TaxID=1431903 RepID=A0A9P0BJ53_BRAAE|nr:unnamed protein product [Brassicogethes aeneus]